MVIQGVSLGRIIWYFHLFYLDLQLGVHTKIPFYFIRQEASYLIWGGNDFLLKNGLCSAKMMMDVL